MREGTDGIRMIETGHQEGAAEPSEMLNYRWDVAEMLLRYCGDIQGYISALIPLIINRLIVC
jgi:hypothetical protein